MNNRDFDTEERDFIRDLLESTEKQYDEYCIDEKVTLYRRELERALNKRLSDKELVYLKSWIEKSKFKK